MNELERRMVEQLQDLRENHHVIGVKAEFEAEGHATRGGHPPQGGHHRRRAGTDDEGRRLRGAARHVRGSRDRRRPRRGPDGRVAVGAAQVRAGREDGVPRGGARPGAVLRQHRDRDRRRQLRGHARRCRTSASSTASCSGGSTCPGSMGLSRDDINSDAVYAVAETALHAGQEPATLSARSAVACRLTRSTSCAACPMGYLDRYETRKVVFGCPEALGDDAGHGHPQGGGLRADVAQEQARLLRPHLRGGPRPHRHAPEPLRRMITQAGGVYE